jgi:hypothetical protein
VLDHCDVASGPVAVLAAPDGARKGGGGVGQLALLLADEQAALGSGYGSRVAEQLTDLGVTSVYVLRDEHVIAVVLAGWAFDFDRSAEAAVRIVAGESREVRILRPVVEADLHAPSGASTATERRHA